MHLETLHRPYIGINLYTDDYAKVQGLLPTATYTDTLQSNYNPNIILIYVMEGYITSHHQYRWISNIKLGLEAFLCVPFKYEEEYHITQQTEVSDRLYSLEELTKAFKAPLITYPKIMYCQSKKELYRHLCWHSKKLIHQKCFTHEALISTALLMNDKLPLTQKVSNRELNKKVLGVVKWVEENQEGFSVKLEKEQLKIAHSKGAVKKNQNQAQKSKEKIAQILESENLIKPNGKVNLTALAKAMNMTRKTVAKYIEH